MCPGFVESTRLSCPVLPEISTKLGTAHVLVGSDRLRSWIPVHDGIQNSGVGADRKLHPAPTAPVTPG